MDTIKFQCGRCRKLMAVTVRDVGKLVRCPHCRQTVQAPSSREPATMPASPAPADTAAAPELPDPPVPLAEAPPPPAPDPALPADVAAVPEIRVPVAVEGDSIFSPPEESSDDLFGVTPEVRLEIPPASPIPDLQIEHTGHPAVEPTLVSPSAPLPEVVFESEGGSTGEATVSFLVVPAPPPDFAAEPPPAEPPSAGVPSGGAPPAAEWPLDPLAAAPFVETPAAMQITAEASPPVVVAAPEPVAAAGPPPLPRRPQSKGALGVFLLVLLVPYAVISTGALVWLIYQQRTRPPQTFDPLERLPDPDPAKGGPKRVKYDSPLPDKLKTGLGQAIRVGDVEVTPLRVERVEEGGKQMLTLHLRLHNVSDDTAFDPLPKEFVFYRPVGRFDLKPYTFLQVGERSAFGGNVEWVAPLPRKGFDGVLRPREQGTILLRTHERYSPVVEELDRHKGPILWRVQVRRGFVPVHGKDVSATAVIGVRLDATTIPLPAVQDARLSPPRAAVRAGNP